ncbi:MAG: hypothetical protein AAF748_11145 [Pseudomonadota bacterium]
MVPESYDDWKHCITVKCGIPLTTDYVQERIAALSNQNDFHTQKFIKRWGSSHHARTLTWFQRAAEELSAGA